MINEEIRDAEVRLIDENGNQQGIVTIDVALRMAEAADLDLVKIPNAICFIVFALSQVSFI